MNGPLMKATIKGFRGIRGTLTIEANGHHIRVSGPNGCGKSSALAALYWGAGGDLDGEVVANGEERAGVELRWEGFTFRRSAKPGDSAKMTVEDDEGRGYKRPAEMARGITKAIGQRSFSRLPSKEQAEILRGLAPGLDVSDLVARKKALAEERLLAGRERDNLAGQLAGIPMPEEVGPIGAERDARAIRGRRRAAEDAIKENATARSKFADNERALGERRRSIGALREELAASEAAPARAQETIRDNAAAREKLHGLAATVEDRCASVRGLEEQLRIARAALAEVEALADRQRVLVAQLVEPDLHVLEQEPARLRAAIASSEEVLAQEDLAVEAERARVAGLVDPDLAAFDRELDEAEEHNRGVQERQRAAEEATRAAAARQRVVEAHAARERAWREADAAMKAVDGEVSSRLGACNLPIPGIALTEGVVTLDDGVHGPVAVSHLNSGARIRLDVVMAALRGQRLAPVEDASLLDENTTREIERFAEEHGVQLVSEVVISAPGDDARLTVEIVEGPPRDAPSPPSQFSDSDDL